MKLELKELYELAEDRPNKTTEIFGPNDFYGHAAVLKNYVQYTPDYQIKAAIEHGANFSRFIWRQNIDMELPAIIFFSSYLFPLFRKLTRKPLFAVGPILRYANCLLDDNTLDSQRKILGKNLLVFPPHSTHWIDAKYSIHKYCEEIEKLGKGFNTIRVCLYWRDILRGVAEEYALHGFECVTAGHMYDHLFLPRLKGIIELATLTASSDVGTHIGYCAMMDKPHFFIKNNFKNIIKNKSDNRQVHLEANDPVCKKNIEEILTAFKEPCFDITSKQREIVERIWGINEIKSADEIKILFQITEDMYKKGSKYFMGSKDVIEKQVKYYLDSDRNQEALFLTGQALLACPQNKKLNYLKSLALARMDNFREAFRIMSDLWLSLPQYKKDWILDGKIVFNISSSRLMHLAKLALRPKYRHNYLAIQKLRNTPRYTPASTDLLGKRIQFVDAASFLLMYFEFFEKEIYKFKAKNKNPLILDCGANIGLSIIYFKQLYPASRIIAFEPDRRIFNILKDNLFSLGLSDIELVNKAVWSSDTMLEFIAGNADEGRLVETENGKGEYKASTVRLRNYLDKHIDFLKLDIEGAETEVLTDCKDLLSNVDNIFIEYHSFGNKPQTLEIILNILTQAGFRFHIHPVITSPQPFYHRELNFGMDNQLNIFAFREKEIL